MYAEILEHLKKAHLGDGFRHADEQKAIEVIRNLVFQLARAEERARPLERQHIAAMVLQGMIGKQHGHVDGRGDAERCAKLSVEYADALIAALASKGCKDEK